MNNREQFRYLFDYYLIKPTAVCLAVGMIIWFVWNYLHPAPQPVIYAAVYDLLLDSDAKTELSAIHVLPLEEEQEIMKRLGDRRQDPENKPDAAETEEEEYTIDWGRRDNPSRKKRWKFLYH